MKKILFFTNGLYGGGAEKVLQTLLYYIDKSKFKITLYRLRQEKLNNLYPKDIIYRYIFSSYSEQSSFLRKILVKGKNKILLWIYYHCSPRIFYKLFIKESYDTEVAFIEGYATRIISGSPNPNSKKIAWVHINLEINHWTTIAYQNSKEEEEAYTKFNQVISVSRSVQATTEKLFKNINNSITLYNPIDTNNIIQLSSQFVPFKESLQRIRLVSVGRYVQQKAFHRLVSITAQLITEGYNIELWLVGEGEQRIALEKQIESLNLKDRVFLTGFQNNPYPYIKNADVFVCSSLTEGYSTVVTEALILECPVVTTDCSGMKELLLNGKCGIITENNEEALYKGIKLFLDSPNIQQQLKQNIRIFNTRFDIHSLMNNIEKIL